MSPIAARKVATQITLTPGTVISRRAFGEWSAWRAIWRSTAAISESRNSTWRMHAATVSASSSGSSSPPSHRRPLTPNRSDTGGRPTSRRTSTAWISFLERDRARTSCSRRANRRRNTRVHSSGDHTASSSPAASSLASVRASNLSVLARACRNTGINGAHHDDPGDVRLEDPRDLPRAPRHLECHPVRRRQALREQLHLLRRRRDPTSAANRAALDERDLAEIAAHVQPDRSSDRSHLVPPLLVNEIENQRA